MKKVAKYDEEELEILQAWEAGMLKPTADMAEQAKAHRAAADATFKKDQRLNIRISSKDLKSLQARALEEGEPAMNSMHLVPMKIAIAGTGYVGLSMAVLLAQHHAVWAVDVVAAKVDTPACRAS
jgi:predicted DNA binding CopG/RHH family protein